MHQPRASGIGARFRIASRSGHDVSLERIAPSDPAIIPASHPHVRPGHPEQSRSHHLASPRHRDLGSHRRRSAGAPPPSRPCGHHDLRMTNVWFPCNRASPEKSIALGCIPCCSKRNSAAFPVPEYFTMRKFRSSLSFWPSPRLRANSESGFCAWIIARETHASRVPINVPSIKRIVEDDHDSRARTIGPRGR